MNGIDLSRLSKAMTRPGIDPRPWVQLAAVKSFYIDADHGCFADVFIQPTGPMETARVGPIFGGDGWGFYAPLAVDDEVVVVAPDGDPNNGLVVVARCWSAASLPPPDPTANPDDVILVVDKDRDFRLRVAGEGNVRLLTDAGKVYIGDDSGTEPIAKGTTLKNWMNALKTALLAHVHPGVTVGTGVSSAPTFAPSGYPDTPAVEATKGQVK